MPRSGSIAPAETVSAFQALINKKQRLPNWQERWCTQHLKVVPLTSLVTTFGWSPGSYTEVIGLRHDEGLRIFKGMENAEKYGRKCIYPLATAKVTKANVMAFWKRAGFRPRFGTVGRQLRPVAS